MMISGRLVKPPDWQRALEIFEEVSELQLGEREAAVERICNGDTTLHRSVRSLLEAHDRENGFLEHAISSYAGRMADAATPGRVGPYRILSKIARGGMSEVFLAERDDSQYQSKVAIKLVHSGSVSHLDLKRRFLTERQILASLRHPNIAYLQDGGVTDDGAPYLVMEYVEGLRFDEYCRKHNLTVRQRIELFRQACAAVQFAHSNLIVHRDIKPSNILVGADGVPKLLDFGIAKLLQPGTMMHTVAMTQPEQRLMTLEYASPEQFRGENVTTAADIYSLGIVLYELLSGAHPFEAQRSDFLSLQHAVTAVEPPPPSTTARNANPVLAAQLDRDLDDAVLKAIRKEPAARYASVERFSEDLGRYLNGYPLEASQGKRRYRIRKFLGRHRLGAAAAAAFILLLAAFSISSAILAARVTRERNEARQERFREQKVSAFLDSMFQGADPQRNSGALPSARDLLDQGAARVSKELAGEPQVSASLLETIGQSYKHLGFYDKAVAIFREEAQAVERAYGPQSEEMGRILRQLGDTERQLGKMTDAETHLRRSLALLEKLPPSRDVQLAHALNNLALLVETRGDLASAETYLRRAVAISAKYPAEAAEWLTMRSNLSVALMNQGKDGEAEPMVREILARRRKLLGESHPQVATSMRQLGTALNNQGRTREAEDWYRQALAKQRALLRPDHPDAVVTVVLLAGALRDEGRLTESESMLREALASDIRNGGEHSAAALHNSSLAYVVFLEGRNGEAAQLLRHAVDILRADGAGGGIREARFLTQLATVNTALGDFTAANSALQQAMQFCARNSKTSAPELAAAQFQLGELQQRQGKPSEADAVYQKALELDRNNNSLNRFSMAGHLLGYASFLGKRDASQAERLAAEARDIESKTLGPDAWQLDLAGSVTAMVYASEGRFAEAEGLGERSYSNLRRKLGPNARPSLAAAARLAALYRAIGKPVPPELANAAARGRNALCCLY